MARQQRRLFLCVSLVWLGLHSRTLLGWTREEAKQQVEKNIKVWNSPHSFRLAGSKFAVDTVSQGALQWQVRATENTNTTPNALFVAREDGGNVVYGLNYDSKKSELKPLGDHRIQFSATGDEEFNDLDWTLRVEGQDNDQPRHLQATGNSDDVVYDGSFGWEKTLKNGLGLLYAVDAKRRSGGEGVLPNWMQQSAGLKYRTNFGDAKVLLFQPDPESDKKTLEYEASWKGKLQGLSGGVGKKILTTDPQYKLKLTNEGLAGKVRAPAKLGTAFGADASLNMDGEKEFSGFAEWKGKKELSKGLELSVDTKATAEEGNVSLAPIGLTLAANLGKLAPKMATDDSSLNLRSRYKLGSDRPSLQARASVSPKKLPQVKAAGEATWDDSGSLSSTLKLTAEHLHGVDARYEMSSGKKGLLQGAEVRLPRVEFQDGSYLRGTGKVYKGADWGEKPRVQLGVQYEGNLRILDKDLKLGGESSGFDSGRNLLDEMGKPWKSPEINKARNSAKVVRNYIKSETGQGRRWISK
ncbi:unnamed protein product [Durusdinium trenchii]|uniref:Uncharacterized protein n=2 Tax=Durusdinium trenchii TaxID=1381693 RepID=A0ABP0JXF9_9DINO